LPSERFVEDHPQGVDVRAAVDVTIARELLWRHVAGRAEDLPRLRERLASVDLRDPEVEQLHLHGVGALLRDEEDVVRLEVAVDHAGAMRGVEPHRGTREDR
jgi:hypothetical protein